MQHGTTPAMPRLRMRPRDAAIVLAADEGVGGALPARQLEAVLGEIDAHDPLGALQARARHGAAGCRTRQEATP